MFLFIVACIFFLVAIGAFIIRAKQDEDSKLPVVIPGVILALSLVLAGSQCVYTQDIGEAIVLRNFGGSLAGYTADAGIHFKAPWQDALDWDIRNRLINFYRDADYAYDNGSYNGATVTINDSSGTSALY